MLSVRFSNINLIELVFHLCAILIYYYLILGAIYKGFMYFIFSKLLLIFILPLTWIIVLLCISLFGKNKKYKYRSLLAAFILLIIFTNPVLFYKYANTWDIPPYKPNSQLYSCVIVLGGFSNSDGMGDGYFNSSADRFLQGVKLVTNHKASHILITGGNGNLISGGFREGLWVQRQLRQFAVPDSVVLIESNSRNTIENARFTKQLLKQSNLPPPYLLVTSAYHMRRSLMIFKNMGVDVVPYPANYIVRNYHINAVDLIPAAEMLGAWNGYIKELVGYAANSFSK